jgi:hypothetical protein
MHLAGTTFGFGTPVGYPGSAATWGFSPSQPYLQPYAGQPISGYGAGQPWQQIQQLLQILPAQVQQLQALQQQQLQYLQQLIQIVPAQLQQLQQLIQIIPQQFQQQSQPFGQAIQNPFALGFLPQPFSSQGSGHVM